MDNKQKASLYAVAKVLGYKKSLDDFIIEYSGHYDETIKELNLRPVEPAKAEAVQSPFHMGYPFNR